MAPVPSTPRVPAISLESLLARPRAILARYPTPPWRRRRGAEDSADLVGAPPAGDPGRRGVILVAGVATLMAAVALYLALWTPGVAGVRTGRLGGHRVVTWVAPNGPAGDAGIRVGDRVVADGGHGLAPSAALFVVREGRRRIVLTAGALAPAALDLLDAALGLCLLLCGASVRLKSPDRAAGAAFWRMCLLAGLTLALLPAMTHGVPWATIVAAVALRLFGPALLDLTLALPGRRRGPARPSRLPWRPPLHWLPALASALLYVASWMQPAPGAMVVPAAGSLLLAIYILAACGRVVLALRAPLSAHERAQLHWLALGLVGGFLPFELLTLLPLALADRVLLPASATILALVSLPLAVGIAVVRVDLLGITVLARRRTLRVLVGAAGLGAVVMAAGAVATEGARRWGWPVAAVAVGAGALAALGAAGLPMLVRRAERLARRDVYDSAVALRELSLALAGAPPPAAGPLAVARLGTLLDLTDALLLTPHDRWAYAHPRTTDPVATGEAVVRRARALFEGEPCRAFTERAAGRRVLFMPVWDGPDPRAVLILGPKRGGESYTRQDQALLDAVAGPLALVLGKLKPRAREPVASHGGADAAAPSVAGRPATEDGFRPDRGAHAPDARPLLTARESEVLEHLAEGRPNKRIATLLGCSDKTVQGHNTSIFAKLNAHNRTEAVAEARRRGLLSHDHGAGLSPDA